LLSTQDLFPESGCKDRESFLTIQTIQQKKSIFFAPFFSVFNQTKEDHTFTPTKKINLFSSKQKKNSKNRKNREKVVEIPYPISS